MWYWPSFLNKSVELALRNEVFQNLILFYENTWRQTSDLTVMNLTKFRFLAIGSLCDTASATRCIQ
jgi:hypothetical protein